MKIYTNFKSSLSVYSWPPERKDIQLLIKWLSRSCMFFPFRGQLLTDNLFLQLVYIFIVPFPVWAGINFFHFLFGLELILIPAQTVNETKKLYTNCQTSLSVDRWPPEGKDMQLLIKICTSFLLGGQLSTDKLVW